MNWKMIIQTLGRMMLAEAGLLLLPAMVAVIYNETCFWSILITIGIALVIGLPLCLFIRPKNTAIYAKEGFMIVFLAWIAVSLVGALPFFLSGEIPNYIDALFETVSGFTTTGASILTNVEAMSHGLLFWRSFTHWVGGMGVLVFIMAILPSVSGRPIHIMRAEMPGPIIDKMVPRGKDTAKILYLIYIGMTLVEVVLLVCGEMDLFESLVHAFGTAGTGGFGVKADGLSGYSPYTQWVISIFMLLFGVNFNLYYLLLIRRFRTVFRNTELITYGSIILGSVVLIMSNIYPYYHNFEQALRHAVFQVSSIMTTTGYATVDFNIWPQFSKMLLLILMIVGACAGSTAGGLKVSRVVILFKIIRRECRRMLHPRSVNTVTMDEKELDDQTLVGVGGYFAVYFICMVVIFLILSLDSLSMQTNISATVSCFNNIGPALDVAGPMGSYASYSALSKITLTLAMLFGRLEIYPLLLLPALFKKR